MTLAPGTRLGPYEIVGQIGAGGMGVVYRANDPKLGRNVAIKVLPEAYAAELDRLKRFQQEARTLSALNHPNILTIHDLGEHEGSPFLVMELLEGETLREKINRKALPARKATEIALQVAKGLSAAHEQGIIHRDLKPENIFVLKDGHVKILDFGLAKVLAPEPNASALGQRSTVALGTLPGMVLGTVGYMAPEQVQGEAMGPPGDLFALGCVLFEMLTGKRAFPGDSAIGILNGILNDDPLKDPTALKGLPNGLVKILERCLQKAPGDRFRSAHDLAFVLEDASTPGSGPMGMKSEGRAVAKGRLIWFVAGLLAVAVGLGGWFLGRVKVQNPALTYTPVTFRRGTVVTARFASDGRSVVYSGAWQEAPVRIFLQRPDQDDATPVGPPGARLLSVSRTGELALLLDYKSSGPFTGSGTLAQMSEHGGDAPRLIEEDVSSADWSPLDGRLALVKDLGDRRRLEFPIGKVVYETLGWLSDLRFSPNGQEIAVLDHPLLEDSLGYPVRLDLGTRQPRWPNPKARISLFRGLAWSPDGREVLVGNRGALVAFDPKGSRRLMGHFPRNVNLHDMGRDGRGLIGLESIQMGMEGRDEAGQRDLSWLSWSLLMDLSADGRQALFTEFGTSGPARSIVAWRGLDGSPVVKLGEGFATGISPDGRWVAAIVRGGEHIDLIPTGSGETRALSPGGLRNLAHARFLPDGSSVVFYAVKEGLGPRLFLQPVDGGEARAVSDERPGFGTIAVAPSGDRFAVTGPDGAPWIFSLSGPARPLPGCTPGDQVIRWDAEGHHVFVSKDREIPARIRRVEVATGLSEPVVQLSMADRDGVRSLGPIAMTADARRFGFSYYRVLSELHIVEGLK